MASVVRMVHFLLVFVLLCDQRMIEHVGAQGLSAIAFPDNIETILMQDDALDEALHQSVLLKRNPFNFSGLNSLYVEALNNDRPAIVFEVRNGIGIFVFMMFFADDDGDSRDRLFLYLARTRQMLSPLKMYGRHSKYEPEKNRFEVYFSLTDQHMIMEELGIDGGGGRPFDFERFLNELNGHIPPTLPLARLQEHCQAHTAALRHDQVRAAVDNAHKVYLIGPKSLPDGQKPKEKTLRKLYAYVRADADVLNIFINELKKKNKTLAWSADFKRANQRGLREMLNEI